MKKASLGTLFLTVFLDLLGYGLVVPFLPRIAREYGASDSTAALIGTAYSLMQFLFIPVWGRLSDRVGRRPVLLVSIAASAVSMAMLGFASSLTWLFVARLLSGMATANIAVAQAYVADVTDQSNRAKGMGIIGVGFGLGFVFGPFIGGELGSIGGGRPGALPALVAAGLSALNFFLALRNVPESLPVEARGTRVRSASPLDLSRLREAIRIDGIAAALGVNFLALLAFSGMEQTFALFTADAFGMSERPTGRVLGFVGLVLVAVQGGLIKPLSRRFGETRLIQTGLVLECLGFFLMGHSAAITGGPMAALFGAAGLIAVANGLINPSLPSYLSRRTPPSAQGTTLGVLQSLGALARVLGPALAGAVYQAQGYRVMFTVLAGALFLGALVSLALRALGRAPAAAAARAPGVVAAEAAVPAGVGVRE